VRGTADSCNTDIVPSLPHYKRHSSWLAYDCQPGRRLIEIWRQAREETVLCKWVAVSTWVKGETSLPVMISKSGYKLEMHPQITPTSIHSSLPPSSLS